MLRFMLPVASILAACSPSPQKAEMPKPSAAPSITDSSAEAQGRRILSTAFVRVGPDGRLTVELRDGRLLVLRNVAMNATDYCGAQVAGNPSATKFCGRYSDVVAARPGGSPNQEPENMQADEPANGPVKAKK
jgi:hypothetical protein